MKIKDLLYETPEMSEERLLEFIEKDLEIFESFAHLENRLRQIHKYSKTIPEILLEEFDLIQEKKSYLSKSQRDLVTGFVGACMIKMAKTKDEPKEDDEYVNFEEVTDGRGDVPNPEIAVPETPVSGNAER